MLKWIRQNRIPVIFITVFLIIVLVVGIQAGLGYLNAERQEFINQVAPEAIEGYEEYGVLPSLTISQAILESNWGKSNIENNLFGMKANDSWKGKIAYRNTKEFLKGKWVTTKAGFKAYDSFSESIEDHAKLLGTLSRYKKVLAADDYKQACMEVWIGGYATDPRYPKKLTDIIERYRLDKYDIQVKETVSKRINYKYFEDVPDSKWYANTINKLYKKKIIKGRTNENGVLKAYPEEYMTRAETFTLIQRILEEVKINE